MSTTTPSLATALASAELLFDRAALESVIVDMGRDIDAALDGERAVFLTVMNGALIFAGHLALAIRTDVEFDYVHATRYRGATSGSELHWLREPMVDLTGRPLHFGQKCWPSWALCAPGPPYVRQRSSYQSNCIPRRPRPAKPSSSLVFPPLSWSNWRKPG